MNSLPAEEEIRKGDLFLLKLDPSDPEEEFEEKEYCFILVTEVLRGAVYWTCSDWNPAVYEEPATRYILSASSLYQGDESDWLYIGNLWDICNTMAETGEIL